MPSPSPSSPWSESEAAIRAVSRFPATIPVCRSSLRPAARRAVRAGMPPRPAQRCQAARPPPAAPQAPVLQRSPPIRPDYQPRSIRPARGNDCTGRRPRSPTVLGDRIYSTGRRGGSSQVYPCLTADPIDLSMGGPTRAFAWGFYFRGFAPTACGLPPGFVVARFRREPAKSWRNRLRRLYSATATRRPVCSGAAPLRTAAYPRALSWLDFAGCRRNRGGIGCADCIPPPPLGARFAQGLRPPAAAPPSQ